MEMAAVIQDPLREARRPELIFKIDGFGCDVHDAIFLPDKDAIVTGTEDRLVSLFTFYMGQNAASLDEKGHREVLAISN